MFRILLGSVRQRLGGVEGLGLVRELCYEEFERHHFSVNKNKTKEIKDYTMLLMKTFYIIFQFKNFLLFLFVYIYYVNFLII